MRAAAHSAPGLRVLALCTDAPSAPGGIARYTASVVRALAGSEHVAGIALLARRGAPETTPAAPGRAATRIEVRRGRARFAGSALASARWRPDLVLCGHMHYAALAFAVARLAGAPMWSFAYGIEAWEAPPAHRRGAVERSDRILAISRHTRTEVLRWARIPRWRCTLLHPAVPDIVATPRRRRPRPDPLLLSVGRLDAREGYKGQDLVIEALPALVRRRPGVRYLVAGDGDDRPRLETLARRLGVRDRVRFLGHVHEDTLQALYRDADAFVMPSTGEGFGIVFIEALAAGLPVIAARAGGSVDPLHDGELGVLVEPGDATALAHALESILSAPPPPVPSSALRGFEESAQASRISMLLADLRARQARGVEVRA